MDTTGYAHDVYVSGDYAYVADHDGGLVIYDISNPTNPAELGQFYDLGAAQGVYVSESYAYVADGFNGLVIFDPLTQKETISNIILWSVIGIISLLVIVDLRYLIKERKKDRDIEPVISLN